jgi:pyruvate formate lyase activating enzyme
MIHLLGAPLEVSQAACHEGVGAAYNRIKNMAGLAEVLARETRDGELYERLPDGRLRCYACGHCCPLPEGAAGVCKVRFNDGGRLRVPWGYVGGVQCDPIEKKPFFHAYPGALAFSFGMLGCDLHCSYCQNWVTSQALRDPAAVAPAERARPEQLVASALRLQARVIVSTYNEPLITSEWAVAVFKEAKRAGLTTGYVSNGNGTPQVLEYIRPWVDLYKVDLKSFDDRHYRQLGGRLEPILDTIRRLHAMDFWVEIVTLLIPGFNDSRDEISRLTAFVASVSPDIPWHVTAFHADYRMLEPQNTTADMLLAAADVGRASGLRYVYAGNLPGEVGGLEDTRCTSCGETLVARFGYAIRRYNVSPEGWCPRCSAAVPGRWSPAFDGQIASRPFLARARSGNLQLPILNSPA